VAPDFRVSLPGITRSILQTKTKTPFFHLFTRLRMYTPPVPCRCTSTPLRLGLSAEIDTRDRSTKPPDSPPTYHCQPLPSQRVLTFSCFCCLEFSKEEKKDRTLGSILVLKSFRHSFTHFELLFLVLLYSTLLYSYSSIFFLFHLLFTYFISSLIILSLKSYLGDVYTIISRHNGSRRTTSGREPTPAITNESRPGGALPFIMCYLEHYSIQVSPQWR
jgi:hypothetical protein